MDTSALAHVHERHPTRPKVIGARNRAEAKYGFARTRETSLRMWSLAELISISRGANAETRDVRDRTFLWEPPSWIPMPCRPRDELLQGRGCGKKN